MVTIAKLLGQIIYDLMPGASNVVEAYDTYCEHLYRCIMAKHRAEIECRDDEELYLTLSSYREFVVLAATMDPQRTEHD